MSSSDRAVADSFKALSRAAETLDRREFLRYAALLSAGVLSASACESRSITDPVSPAQNRRGLHRNFIYGAAITDNEVRNIPDILRLVEQLCGMVTFAGPFYWRSLRPDILGAGAGDGHGHPFDFTGADRCTGYAASRHLRMRGHNLLWYQLNPQWLIRELNASNADFILREHITTTVGRYRGMFHSWDVMNEIAHPQDGRTDGLRDSIWMKVAGPRHLRLAFEVAHDADPSTLLGYNEFGIHADDEASDMKRRAVLNFVSQLVRERIPIHYLGVQSHLWPDERFSDRKLGVFLRAVRDLGVQIHITELDVSDQFVEGDIAHRDAVVADAYDRFLSVVLKAVEIPTLSTWGLSDVDSWLQKWPRLDGSPVRPLPFDAQLRSKPAWSVLAHYLSDPTEGGCVSSFNHPDSLAYFPVCWLRQRHRWPRELPPRDRLR